MNSRLMKQFEIGNDISKTGEMEDVILNKIPSATD